MTIFSGPVTFAEGSVTITITEDASAITAPILAALAASTATTGAHMSELDDRLADLQATADGNTAAIARLVADFEAAGSLTDAQRAKLDALKQHLLDNQATIDAADPAAPVV